MGVLLTRDEARARSRELREAGKVVIFTNGVFDLLHRGHVDLLVQAKDMGDYLIVGMNSDASVRRLKGPSRPLVPEEDRAVVLAALAVVDAVVLFEEDTPLELIRELAPEVLVKGSDYRPEDVVGADLVPRVELVPLTPGRSTTGLVRKMESGSGDA